VLFAGNATASGHSPYQTTRKNAGTPNSTIVKKNASGVVISYGNSSIMYNAPSSALDTLGEALFMQNCASCHGTKANGVPANGTSGAYPDLVGLGPATIDFWVDSGSHAGGQPPRDRGAAPFPAPDPRPGPGRRGVGQLTRPQLSRHSRRPI
jgi:mono/diheme cytochrome c family protein